MKWINKNSMNIIINIINPDQRGDMIKSQLDFMKWLLTIKWIVHHNRIPNISHISLLHTRCHPNITPWRTLYLADSTTCCSDSKLAIEKKTILPEIRWNC